MDKHENQSLAKSFEKSQNLDDSIDKELNSKLAAADQVTADLCYDNGNLLASIGEFEEAIDAYD